jgi:hypothetical protein
MAPYFWITSVASPERVGSTIRSKRRAIEIGQETQRHKLSDQPLSHSRRANGTKLRRALRHRGFGLRLVFVQGPLEREQLRTNILHFGQVTRRTTRYHRSAATKNQRQYNDRFAEDKRELSPNLGDGRGQAAAV